MKQKTKNIVVAVKGTNIFHTAIKGVTRFIQSGPLRNYLAYAERKMH